MKKFVLLGVLIFSFAAAAAADEITFSFVIGMPGSLTASAAGLTAGPSTNVLVTDVTTSTTFTLPGTFTASSGSATMFTALPALVLATYAAGGTDSVLIVDPSMNPLLAGTMNGGGLFVTSIPNGAGAYLATFDVTSVSAAVLGMFGLGPTFAPGGSVALTFADDNFDGTTVTGTIGGGTATVTTTVIPEPASLGLLGVGLLTIAGGLRRRVRASRASRL